MYNFRHVFFGGELTPLKKILVFLFFALSLSADPLYQEVLKSAGLRDSVYVDPQTNFVFEGKYIGRTLYGPLSISPLSTYLEERLENAILSSLYEKLSRLSGKGSKAGSYGLIPDIEIPIKFPKGLSFIGEGGKLQIEGQQKITLGGTSNYTTGVPRSEMARSSHFPQLTMNQELNVRLKGTIGQKIKVEIDHDSRRENRLKNKVILKYEGDEDDIVKLIEAGDTRLGLEGSKLVNFPGGVKQGLFGIKTVFQLGGLSATFVATREQGESQAKTFRSSAAMESTTIYAVNYIKHRFFYIYDPDGITHLRVFLDDDDQTNDAQQGAVTGVMYYYPTGSYNPDYSIDSVSGKFFELQEGQDFRYNPATRLLVLNRPLSDGEKLGVYYLTNSGNTVGDLQDTSRIVLKMIKPPLIFFPGDSLNPDPATHEDSAYLEIWNYELRNYYSLNATNISADQLTLIIYKDSSGVLKMAENGKTYLQLLGLDANGDGKVDRVTNRGFTILDEENGILAFPNPFPFADTVLQEPDSSFYWKPRVSSEDGKKYVIVVKMARAVKTYNLGFDVIEGSEVVIVNGQRLQRGRDYTIDYSLGYLTITNSSVLTPGADIEISYEIAPLFAVKQRSLWGARFKYTLGEHFYIGSTWLGRSESSPERKPRLGEEPLKNFLGGIDFNLNLEFMFLSKLLNLLPFISVEKPSTFNWSGEYAVSFPNPNTLGKAYLDDMESIRDATDFPINRSYYIYGSQPLIETPGGDIPADTAKLVDRLIWASPGDLVRKGDVYPNINDETRDELMYVLMIMPQVHNPGNDTLWASLNTLISKDAEDFEKKEYLEVIVKGDGLKLHIDFGKNISENSIWRDRAGRIRSFSPDTIADEDLNFDGIFDADSEDVGLDRYRGDDDAWSQSSPDDGIDDYYYDSNNPHDYSRVNGTEGNRKRDSEDLDLDGVLNISNDYFEYTIDLDDTTFLNRYGFEYNGWKHYSIPLRDINVLKTFGNPSWRFVKYARIWIDGITRTDTLMIASISVVGTKWENKGIFSSDSTLVDSTEVLKVGTVDNKTNPYYTPPPWVEIERDQRGRELKEGSLSLQYTNIQPNHYGLTRRILYQDEDFLTYKKIEFSVKVKPGTPMPYPEVFVRFGDTTNFYEYNFQIPDNDWHRVVINIDSLTQFKLRYIRRNPADTSYHREGPYGVKGNPTFGRVKVYMIGLRNNSSTPISGTVWIDDIVLSDPIRERGSALSTKVSLNLADFTSVTVNYSREEDNFMKLMDTRRTRGQVERFSLSLQSQVHQLFPRQLGLNIPITFTYTWSRSLPKYETNTDILLSEDQKKNEQSFSYSRYLQARFSKSGSRFFLFKYLIDPLSLSFTNRVTANKSPVLIDSTDNLTLSGEYNLSFNKTLGFKLLGTKFNFLPSSIKLSAGYGRSFSRRFDIKTLTITKNFERNLTFGTQTSYSPFRNLRIGYNRNLAFDLNWKSPKWYGTETSFEEGGNVSYTLSFLKGFSPTISYNGNYREEHTKDIQIQGAPDMRNGSFGNQLRVSATVPVSEVLKKIASLRDESKDRDLENAGPVHYLLYLLDKLSTLITSPSISYDNNISMQKFHILERPELPYRLGMIRKFQVLSYDSTRDTKTTSNSYTLNGSLTVPFVSLSYNLNYRYSENSQYGSATYTKTYTLPGLQFTFSTLSKLLGKFGDKFSSISLTSGITRSLTENGNLILGKVSSKTTEMSMSPNLTVVLRNGLQTTLQFSRNTSKTEYFDLLSTPLMSSRMDLSLNSSYTFSRPGGYTINLPGNRVIRIKSRLNFNLLLRYSHSTQKRKTVISDLVTKSISLTGSYEFARNILGSLQIFYSSNGNRLTGRTNHSISLNATAQFNF